MNNSKKIAYLNANRLRRALVAGAENVVSQQEHLDSINVFPVPDGDTGKNMAGTMKSIADGVQANSGNKLDNIAEDLTKSALIGARGNSGAILAQFMSGFSESVKDLDRIYPKDFIHAVKVAAQKARAAMSKPQEGTIITVIQDWADHLEHKKHDDFAIMMKESRDKLHQSLQETKEKLHILKAKDVVDAGAQGFVYMIEGILDFTERGSINDAKPAIKPVLENEIFQSSVHKPSLTNSYCTECLLEGEKLNLELIKRDLEIIGDSVVVSGNPNLVRAHVHTNDPEEALRRLARYAKVTMPKIEDMNEQVKHNTKKTKQKIGIVTDSTCDLPVELLKEYDIEIVPLRIHVDNQEFVDKIDFSPAELNEKLAKSTSAKTSQPAPADFIKAYTKHLEKYEKIISIHLMEMYSGTVQSAHTVSKAFGDKITVIDAQILCGGLGLVVYNAAQRAKANMEYEEIIKLLEQDIKNVRVFVAMDTLDFAVRGGRMNKNLGTVAKLLNIKAVIEFATRNLGRVDVVAKAFGPQHCEKRLIQLAKKDVENMQNVQFCLGHVYGAEACKRVEKLLKAELNVEPLYVFDASSVLGVQSGPGAVGLCFLGENKE